MAPGAWPLQLQPVSDIVLQRISACTIEALCHEVEVRSNPTAEDETTKSMKVCQQTDGTQKFRHGPGIALSLRVVNEYRGDAVKDQTFTTVAMCSDVMSHGV